MTETSRSQVTITLGRSGQVVKRAGAVLDNELSDPVPAVGSKRSVRDRLGSSADAVQFDNKRLRGDNGRLNLKASNFMDDFHLSKDDLRFKIMKKTQTNGQQNTMDLRDMLTRRARLSNPKPIISHEPRQGIQRAPDPETRDERRRMADPHRMPEPRNERKGMLNPRDPQVERQRVGDDRCRMPESRDDRDRDRQRMGEPPRAPKLNDMRQRAPEPTNGTMTGKYTSMRTSEAPPHMDFSRNAYSSWTLDHIRRKSPVLHNSRDLSPPPPPPQPPRRTIIREYGDHPRTVPFPSRDISEISRPMPTPPFMTKPSLSAGPTKSIGPLVTPSLPPGSNLQRSQYPVEEHLTVEGFLRSLGLEKYVISFKVEEVDMAALSQMGDHDLKELGIPMGPRKKILLALVARTRRQAR